MEINIRDRERIVEVWLTNEEKNDEKLKESLKPMYTKYKKEKYVIAVYESGDGDLYEGTQNLLIQNLKSNS